MYASRPDHFTIPLHGGAMMDLNKGKKRKRQHHDNLSGEEAYKLDTILYHYGGEEMILKTKEDTPIEVLQAYHTLNRIYGCSSQCMNALADGEKQKTIAELKMYCFQFIQNTFITHAQWNPSTQQSIGGKMFVRNGAQIMTSMPPPIVSSSGKYHSQWMTLVRKVQVLLKIHDKTMKKCWTASATSTYLCCLNSHSSVPCLKKVTRRCPCLGSSTFDTTMLSGTSRVDLIIPTHN